MMDGSKISCIGIIGDGCGGGREFIVEDETLYAFYDVTDEKIELLKGVINAISISKKECIITIVCESRTIILDLSKIY
jgi:hypothetical protein